MRTSRTIALFWMLGFVWIIVSQQGWAQLAPPPSKDAIQTECDPIRRHVLRLNQRPVWETPFLQPRVAQLKRQYSHCFERVQATEFEYLRQAEIPNHPGPYLHTPQRSPRFRWWPWGFHAQ